MTTKRKKSMDTSEKKAAKVIQVTGISEETLERLQTVIDRYNQKHHLRLSKSEYMRMLMEINLATEYNEVKDGSTHKEMPGLRRGKTG